MTEQNQLISSEISPSATVVITTKNRCDDLCRAVDSVLSQDVPVELLVIDDGSSDGTSDLLRRVYPEVRVERRGRSAGLIIRRNEGACHAASRVIISIDDDAEFSTPSVVRETLGDFDASPRVGAVAIPCVDVNRSPDVRQPYPEDGRVYAAAEYIGTAHAVRRDLFLALGGYREELVHQGEERDFCIRLLAAGYLVRLGTSDIIRHFESPRRDTRRMDYYGRRNDVLFACHNTPAAALPTHLTGTVWNGLRFGLTAGHPLQAAAALAAGFGAALTCRTDRRPVPPSVYRIHRRLRTEGAVPLDEVVTALDAAGIVAGDGFWENREIGLAADAGAVS